MVEGGSGVEVLVAVTEVVRGDQHLAHDHALGGEQLPVGGHEVDLADCGQCLQALGLGGPLDAEPLHASSDGTRGHHDDLMAGVAHIGDV